MMTSADNNGEGRKTDRVLTDAEAEAFMKACYVQAMEQDLQDYQDLIASYELKLQAQNDYIRIMEKLQAEREHKLQKLQKTLEQLEMELTKLYGK